MEWRLSCRCLLPYRRISQARLPPAHRAKTPLLGYASLTPANRLKRGILRSAQDFAWRASSRLRLAHARKPAQGRDPSLAQDFACGLPLGYASLTPANRLNI